MTPTRSTFAGLSTWEIVFWYCLIAVSTAIFKVAHFGAVADLFDVAEELEKLT